LQKYFYCKQHPVVGRLRRPGPCPGRRLFRVISAPMESAHSGLLGNLMNMMAPCCSGDDLYDLGEDLMTRSQVATLFRVTSAAVASWARRGRLPEVRNEDGRPRYRRADVEELFRSGMRWRPR
jgi:Helix-turn-helix domain